MRRAGEDYLESILQLEASGGGKGVRITDLALKLDVSKPSVNRAMNHLREEGFIEQESYGNIYLSDKGRRLAEDVYLRHQMLMSFFVEVLEVDPETAENDACRMEHDISRESLDKLTSFMAGGRKPHLKGPALVDLVEEKVKEHFEAELSDGNIRAYELRFDDRFSPVSFRYRNREGRLVSCMLKYEGFDTDRLEIKSKTVNYLLSHPGEELELWYVRRSEGRHHVISVAKGVRPVLERLSASIRKGAEGLRNEGAALGCYKFSVERGLFDFRDLLEL